MLLNSNNALLLAKAQPDTYLASKGGLLLGVIRGTEGAAVWRGEGPCLLRPAPVMPGSGQVQWTNHLPVVMLNVHTEATEDT